MSTKINVRSPYYLRLEEPTETLGAFTCETAGLVNFQVSDNGNIRTPDIAKGRIIQASDTSFPANTSGSSISRTVTYTIGIPDVFSNSNIGTIDCDQTFDQPTQPAIQDPNTNDNCPTVSSQPSDFTASGSNTVAEYTLSSIFSAGSGSSIGRYAIRSIYNNGIVAQISSGKAVFTTSNCASAAFYIRAFNSTDNCYVDTDTFNVTGVCADAYDCDEAALVGGSVAQDGTVTFAAPTIGTFNDVLDGSTSIFTSKSVSANNTGSDRTVTITYRLNVPSGYTNSGTIDCDIDYTQPAAAPSDPEFTCSDVGFSSGFVSENGTISRPSLRAGSIASYTPQFFEKVQVDTNRLVTFTINVPSSGFSNSGSTIDCPYTMTQAADTTSSNENAGCGTFQCFISKLPFLGEIDACFDDHIINLSVTSTVSTATELKTVTGQKICLLDANGQALQPMRGNNQYWAIDTEIRSFGTSTGTFTLLQITDDGIVTDIKQVNCGFNFTEDRIGVIRR